ncbi:hypothetical protein JOD54_003883 [Actinokineospora baliensis]|uniref:hypothetical protein n=1 Tax=Actinokineospora baliensis TaxID=547056 RepID=UPI0019572170|nr:hypothetical protein [Actinokineospora baliensis]MBM7773679.1 hypothetical protein [Actinokineospora baliensis]
MLTTPFASNAVTTAFPRAAAQSPPRQTLRWDQRVDHHQRLIDFLAGADPQEVPSWRAG